MKRQICILVVGDYSKSPPLGYHHVVRLSICTDINRYFSSKITNGGIRCEDKFHSKCDASCSKAGFFSWNFRTQTGKISSLEFIMDLFDSGATRALH